MDEPGELSRAISQALDSAVDPSVPFLGLGVDVVRISRFTEDRKREGTGLFRKVFTDGEAAYCRSRTDQNAVYAGTFAAKEAVYKALGLEWDGAFSWKWIEIQRNNSRRPEVFIANELLRQRSYVAEAVVTVSITHAGEYAAAVAVALGR